MVEGDDLSLICHVTGNPPPDVLWIRGSDNSVLTRSTTVTLPNVGRSDSGLFQCYAWNGIGKNASSNVTVDVLCEYIEANLVKSFFCLLLITCFLFITKLFYYSGYLKGGPS